MDFLTDTKLIYGMIGILLADAVGIALGCSLVWAATKVQRKIGEYCTGSGQKRIPRIMEF